MKRLSVPLPGREYDILIGRGLIDQAGGLLAGQFPPSRVALVSDETVFSLYGARLTKSLQKAGFQPFVTLFPPGEQTKSFAALEKLCNAFQEHNLLRREPVVALGGGVIGDLAGMAAAVYMRGVPFVQTPTTLLAQVDSSVGGKTAVNLPGGKNMAGAFHQPSLVLADTAALDTLTDRDFASGMAEVVKTAAIGGEDLLQKLEKAQNRNGIMEMIDGIVEDCCRFKGKIVLEDERERDLRRILNFGHTFGHAIEKLGGFARYTHGEAVAIGMVLAARTGQTLRITPKGLADRLSGICRSCGLPVESEYAPQTLIPHMKSDKKNEGGDITLVLLESVGKPIVQKVSADRLRMLMEEEADG